MEFAERRIKTRNRSLRLFLLGVAVFILLAAMQLLAPARADLWWQVFFETLHIPLFGVIAVCLLAMTPSDWHRQGRLIVALAATLFLALLSEAIQIPMPNRSASIDDLINDMAGAVAFTAAAMVLSPSFHVPSGRGRWLILFAALILIWPLKPFADISLAYWERYGHLPSIAPLGSRHAEKFFLVRNADVLAKDAKAGDTAYLEFRFGDAGSSSIDFHDPWSNWLSYRALVLDIDNLGAEPLPLVIRIHDETHLRGSQPHEDRFNRRLEFVPGRQTIRIDLADVLDAPAGRTMDMAHIDGIVIFGTEREAGSRFIIHDIRLD